MEDNIMKKRVLAWVCLALAAILVAILVTKLMRKSNSATDEPEAAVHDTVYIDRVDTIIIHDTIEVAPQPAKNARKQNYNLVDEGERIIREGERIMRGGSF